MKTSRRLFISIATIAGMQDRAWTTADPATFNLLMFERERILSKAVRYLDETPETVTAVTCERSAGGPA